MDQNFEDVVMECNNCHLEFSAAELQTDVTTNLLMCVNCLRAPGSRINILKDRPVKKQEIRETAIPKMNLPLKKEQTQKVAIPAGFAHYRCTSCRYEFQRKTGFSNPCPYCSKKSISLVRAN